MTRTDHAGHVGPDGVSAPIALSQAACSAAADSLGAAGLSERAEQERAVADQWRHVARRSEAAVGSRWYAVTNGSEFIFEYGRRWFDPPSEPRFGRIDPPSEPRFGRIDQLVLATAWLKPRAERIAAQQGEGWAAGRCRECSRRHGRRGVRRVTNWTLSGRPPRPDRARRVPKA